MTALLSMYDKWAKAASKGQITGVVLVDLSAAFDLVPPKLLIEKLKVYGVQEEVINWIQSYLTERFQSVWIDHTFSDLLENNTGVPQGSILGPLLFLIYFNDLPVFLKEDVNCYADDSTVSSSGKDVNEIGEKLTNDCQKLTTWMTENGFKLNAEKTHLLMVGSTARLRGMPEPNVLMDGVQIKVAEDDRESLLGVEIQSSLKWNLHIESLVSKLKSRLAGLDKLKSIMGRDQKKKIFQGVFNSVLSYCLPLFGGCSKQDLGKLQILQNKAVRLVLNLPPRISRKFMFDTVNWLTVRQLIAYHSLLTVYSVRTSRQPAYLSELLLRDNHNGHIIVRNVQLSIYRNSFVFRGSVLWNKLPRILRDETRKEKFKMGLKSWITENVERFED